MGLTREAWILAVCLTVYLGMFLGGLPRLKLDRTGVALLGAIALVGGGAFDVREAAAAVDLPTLLLLFSFMVLSAQMRLGGFYARVTLGVAALPLAPPALLAALIAIAAAIAAVFSNDVVCLAMTPLVARICLRRGLAPVPYLLGLACAANLGSAATLIGNPQNMLLGSLLEIPFGWYSAVAMPPVLVSLLLLWLCLRRPAAEARLPPRGSPDTAQYEFDRWQTTKGLLIAAVLIGVFLLTDWPRETAALVAAGVVLLSRRFHSSHVLAQIDWELLVLFVGLFVVNHALEAIGGVSLISTWLGSQGFALNEPGVLIVAGAGLSNLISNVPAVMLLAPQLDGAPAGALLALASTFAGNLLLIGSIANLIVADLARREGIEIGWWAHARVGVPVTLGSLALVWLWLAWR